MTDNNVLAREGPELLFVSEEPQRGATLRASLEAAGWRVRLAGHDMSATLGTTGEPLALVLLDLAEASHCTHAASAIRGAEGPVGTVPILAMQAPDGFHFNPESSGVDAMVPQSAEPAAVVRLIENWRPVSLQPTRRIAAMFGAGPIAGMIERLARRLEAAMIGMDHGTFSRAEAHRLAGLCGTLGFGQAHAAWLDLSHGDETALEEVRRTTRLTLSAIARGL